MKSGAYLDDVSGWDSDKSVRVVDLIATKLESVVVSNFRNLQVFRASRSDIKEITFYDLPELVAIDLSISVSLVRVFIVNCPKLKVFDASFNSELTSIQGDFRSLEYLSCPCAKISQLPPLPNLRYLNSSYTNYLKFKLGDFPSLERFYCVSFDKSNFTLSEISGHKQLRCFECKMGTIKLDKFVRGSKLECLSLKRCDITGSLSIIPSSVCLIKPDGQMIGNVSQGFQPYSYEKSLLYLYGPWPVPPLERISHPSIENVFNRPIINVDVAADAIMGAIFGSAIMDMMGLGVEFLDGNEAKIQTAGPMSILWTHPHITDTNASFVRGTCTDDTSQAVLIMRSLVNSNTQRLSEENPIRFKVGECYVDLNDFANRLVEWKDFGHKEHKDGGGLGMGKTVKSVLSHKMFLADPIRAAEDVWVDHRKNLASNGSVMRIAPVGCFCFWDNQCVKKIAELFGKTTHADPRCVFSTVAISLIVSRIIQQKCGMNSFNYDEIIEEAIQFIPNLEPYLDEIRFYSSRERIEDLKLDKEGIGFTLKAFGAAVWALKHSHSFEEAMISVIREGGDTDTNGAVVGAVLGALHGFHNLPHECLKYMFNGQWLYNEVVPFMRIMGIEPLLSPWKDQV